MKTLRQIDSQKERIIDKFIRNRGAAYNKMELERRELSNRQKDFLNFWARWDKRWLRIEWVFRNFGDNSEIVILELPCEKIS